MPGKVKVKILAGRNLPVMDRSSDTTDAYVEIKLGNTTHKTDVCRKSLNPQWNSEWYRYEVDDSELQDEPLQIRLMDYDTYTANDAIGKVYLDLNPLLLPAAPAPVKSAWNSDNSTASSTSLTGGSVMSGWIPVFDTMHGIRGEVNVIVKVELFSDFNKFRQSSCGVQFFCSPVIPQGYHAQVIHGFVEELVVNDDPEYQWIDKIRTPRASNEARQTLFFKLSGEVQRKIGLKALDLGGNAVIGYNQCFDLEGESGIVVRGIGTAVTLTKLQEISSQPPLPLDISAIDERGGLLPAGRLPTVYATVLDGMVGASSCLVESSDSGLLQPLTLCVAPPSPKLCVTPPTPNLVSPTSPPLTAQPSEGPRQSLLPTLLGSRFASASKLKPKKKKPRHPLLVLPRYLPTDPHNMSRPDLGRHFSQPATDLRSISSSYKKVGRSTQSLSSSVEEAASFRNLLQQEDMRSEAQHGNKFARGLRALRLFPQNKLSKRLIALKTKLQSDSSMEEEEVESKSVGSCDEPKVKFERRHSRSSSDSMAAAIIRSLMESNTSGLDRVVEVKESPGSSPTSPSRKDSYVNTTCELDSSVPPDVHITISESFLRLPPNDDGPELRYVDGHLISNTSSNVSSTSDSSSSEEDASEDYSIDVPIKDNTPSIRPTPSPVPKTSDGSSSDVTPIGNAPSLVDTLSADNDQSNVYEQVTDDSVYKSATKLDDHFFSSIQCDIDSENVPSTNTKSKFEQNFNFSPINDTPMNDDISPHRAASASLQPSCPDMFPNQENVEYFHAPAGKGQSNSLSAGACKIDVVLDIPAASPLHKSRSATTLSLCPFATVEHVTNEGELQFHNIKHGPCFVPPSRQQPQPQLFTAAEDDKQPTGSPPSVTAKISPSPAKLSTVPGIHRRSSDSDLSITPKGNSLTGSDRSSTMGGHLRQGPAMVRPSMNQESLDMMEYPFLTMSKYPPGFILHLGGTVSSRSVKLLERITNLEEPETRDAWWTELRMEVRSHARALGCNVVLGYSEHTSICDDVCVLSASGTAAVINLQFSEQDTSGGGGSQHVTTTRAHLHTKELMTTSLDRTDFERDKSTPQKGDTTLPFVPGTKVRHPSDGYDLEPATTCSVCHIPYSETSVPFRVTMLKCAVCRRGKVPDVLFTTIELPEAVATTGKGCFLQAYVCRPKRDCRGELNAKEISDGLPFLEYELHRVLINKLKVKGMNSIFGLKVQVSIGERMLVGLATGTAVFLTPLPLPAVPKVSAGNSWADDKKLAEIQKLLQDTVKKNRELYQLKPLIESELQSNGRVTASDTEDSDDELPDLDLAAGNKDTCVLEVDDAEDVDVISLLIDPRPPEGFHVVNTETVPGLDEQEVVRNLQMFTQVWRAKIPTGQPTSVFSKHVHRVLQSVYFKLRRMIPCALCNLQFGVELPEPDELQISVLGMALGLGEPEKPSNKFKRKVIIPSASKEAIKKTDDCELIFNLDEDHVVPENHAVTPAQTQVGRSRPRSPLRSTTPQTKPHHTPLRERYGVDMTPLSYVPGGKIERYLGNLNFFFIRESTCIREGGGLSGFVHSFVTEVLAIVRAHVTALGGNAMVAYFMSECVLYHNPHKNQGQCLINVGGDVVHVSYYPEE
ncbi:C2 domain-containing protein 5 isoform X2 [Periplaneta americana]|uniref:C2 domain-containing protein 5 isoform X2 n=1 Tax=Periplaneta americana TaxID=6978 RepID=UPI0037E9B321